LAGGDRDVLGGRRCRHGVAERREFGEHDRAARVCADIAAAEADTVDVAIGARLRADLDLDRDALREERKGGGGLNRRLPKWVDRGPMRQRGRGPRKGVAALAGKPAGKYWKRDLWPQNHIYGEIVWAVCLASIA
jgi:hypothetical protein